MASKIWDMVRLIRHGGPALCNIAVTNSCNATCDFCNFANGKVPRKDLRWIDPDQFASALAILHRKGIRYVSFFGGEPLLHPRLAGMIGQAVECGMGAAMITNGWLLAAKLEELAAAGLKTVYVSIDSAAIAAHESNRGLKGLGDRIRQATARMPALGMTALAGAVLLSAMLQTLCFAFSDATPGMRLARIGLCTFSDENPTRGAMLRRVPALLLSPGLFGLGFVWSLLDQDRLTWHDLISRMYQRSY